MYYILVMTEDTVQVSQCRCERGSRRIEAVRDEMRAKVSWTLDEHVVLPMQRRNKADVNVLGMEDVRVKARPIGNSTRIASWIQMRKEILEITRTQQHTDSNLVPVQIGVQPKSSARAKTARTQGTNRPRK